MLLYGLTIFASAFLLFLVQPLIGKAALPWFGSSPAVWTTSLVFFQVALLVGYAYAHGIARALTPRAQALTHAALIGVALLALPIALPESWKPTADADPASSLLALLGIAVGGPFVLLAAASPLLQQWAAGTERVSPYRLYALSNAGSLLALLTYPLLFEPYLRVTTQLIGWSAGFGAVAVLGGLCVIRRYRTPDERPPMAGVAAPIAGDPEARPGVARLALWLGLSACASIVLLATLNQMNQDLPPVPFLFVLPLSLYLATFILAFDRPRWYHRPLWNALLPIAIAAGFFDVYFTSQLRADAIVAIYSIALFSCCMSAHGELVRLRPGPANLTLFYLMVALGGALGGVLVGVAAPLVFTGLWEYEIGLLATGGLVLALGVREIATRGRRRVGLALGGLVTLGVVGGLVPLASRMELLHVLEAPGEQTVERSRSFFGSLSVVEAGLGSPALRRYQLLHGRIRHGFQFLAPEHRRTPTSYYTAESGVGLAIRSHPARAVPGRRFRIGVVGLGAGILSAYARPGDELVYYEINPDVVRIEREYFTFSRDARARGARVETLVGDARMVMERQLERAQAQGFDVLVLDAFTGDAVPLHLLTREALVLYRAHLAPGGVLALHISSHYVRLLPVARGLAEDAGLIAWAVIYVGEEPVPDQSTWVLMVDSLDLLSERAVRDAVQPLSSVSSRSVLWTDDYSSVLPVLRWSGSGPIAIPRAPRDRR